MRAKGLKVRPGSFAENITTEGLVLYTLPVGTRLRLGTALAEVTQIGKVCHANAPSMSRRATASCRARASLCASWRRASCRPAAR